MGLCWCDITIGCHLGKVPGCSCSQHCSSCSPLGYRTGGRLMPEGCRLLQLQHLPSALGFHPAGTGCGGSPRLMSNNSNRDQTRKVNWGHWESEASTVHVPFGVPCTSVGPGDLCDFMLVGGQAQAGSLVSVLCCLCLCRASALQHRCSLQP